MRHTGNEWDRGGTGLAQLFDWLMGEETERVAFTKEWLKGCTFYETDFEMRRASELAERENKSRALKVVT